MDPDLLKDNGPAVSFSLRVRGLRLPKAGAAEQICDDVRSHCALNVGARLSLGSRMSRCRAEGERPAALQSGARRSRAGVPTRGDWSRTEDQSSLSPADEPSVNVHGSEFQFRRRCALRPSRRRATMSALVVLRELTNPQERCQRCPLIVSAPGSSLQVQRSLAESVARTILLQCVFGAETVATTYYSGLRCIAQQ